MESNARKKRTALNAERALSKRAPIDKSICQQALIDVPPLTILEIAAGIIRKGIRTGLSPEIIAEKILALANWPPKPEA